MNTHEFFICFSLGLIKPEYMCHENYMKNSWNFMGLILWISTIEYGATWKLYEKLMKFYGVKFQQLNMELHDVI